MDHPNNLSELERFVKSYHDAGIAWVDAKLTVDQLEDDLPSFLSAIKNQLADGNMSEEKIKRLALADPNYRKQVQDTAKARADMLRKKVKYDSWDKMFEAKRSKMSFEKEQMKFLPHTVASVVPRWPGR